MRRYTESTTAGERIKPLKKLNLSPKKSSKKFLIALLCFFFIVIPLVLYCSNIIYKMARDVADLHKDSKIQLVATDDLKTKANSKHMSRNTLSSANKKEQQEQKPGSNAQIDLLKGKGAVQVEIDPWKRLEQIPKEKLLLMQLKVQQRIQQRLLEEKLFQQKQKLEKQNNKGLKDEAKESKSTLENDIEKTLTTRNEIVLVTVGNGDIDLFINWYCSVNKLGLVKHVLVFTNVQVATLLKSQNVKNVVFFKNDRGYSLAIQKHMFISLLLQKNINVLLTTCDAIWFRDPLEHISKLKPASDIIGKRKAMDDKNVSFDLVYLNSTHATKNSWRQMTKSSMFNELKTTETRSDEDVILNKYLKSSNLTINLLSEEFYPPDNKKFYGNSHVYILGHLDLWRVSKLKDIGLLTDCSDDT